MDALQLTDVRYTYEDGGSEILHGITLTVKQGEFLCILGHNGSGKSTLAKLLNGLYVPTAGTVLVNGMDTADEEHFLEVRKTAGMVFQNPDNQLVATIVEDDVAFAPENLGVPTDEIRRRVDDSLAAVNMSDFKNSAPHKLSGGQKQRVAIAGVLAMEPAIMILDEPTAMLDPLGRAEVLNTVLKLNREKHITVVYITHFMEEAVSADRITVISDGSVAMSGTPREVFSHGAELKSMGLDVPEMAELSGRLREAGMNIPQGILSVKELADAICPLK